MVFIYQLIKASDKPKMLIKQNITLHFFECMYEVQIHVWYQ